jgi:hypothetical protein
MILSESIVEEAPLMWSGDRGYAVGSLLAPKFTTRQATGPHLAPGESAVERHAFGEIPLGAWLLVRFSHPYILLGCTSLSAPRSALCSSAQTPKNANVEVTNHD